jgi:hypothetical protein
VKRVTAAALAALLVLALTGCGEGNGDGGDGDGGVPWWVFWMATQNNRTEVHHYAPGYTGPRYVAPPRSVPRAPAFKSPSYSTRRR